MSMSFSFLLVVMDAAELARLEKLTAISLTEEEKPAFLKYFTQMKEMFEKFRDARREVLDGGDESVEATLSSEVIGPSHLFSETKLTDPEPILENVLPERMHDHAIEAGAVF